MEMESVSIGDIHVAKKVSARYVLKHLISNVHLH